MEYKGITDSTNDHGGVIVLALGKTLNSTQMATISNRFQVYRDFQVFRTDRIPNISAGYHRIVGEMIQVDCELGGNGLGYQDGSSFTYINNNGSWAGGVKLPAEIFNEYKLHGYDASFGTVEYDGHHINCQEFFDGDTAGLPDLTHDPDNLILLKRPHVEDNNVNQLPLADNIDRIERSYRTGISNQFFLGLLITSLLGFLFGFIIEVATGLISNRRKHSLVSVANQLKALLKPGVKMGVSTMLLGLGLNLVMQLVFLFLFGVLHFNSGEVGIHFISLLVYVVLSFGVYTLGTLKKKHTLESFFVGYLPILSTIGLMSAVGIISLFVTGLWKILGWMISLGIIMVLRLGNVNQTGSNDVGVSVN